jgi:hypothetical protein
MDINPKHKSKTTACEFNGKKALELIGDLTIKIRSRFISEKNDYPIGLYDKKIFFKK